MQSFPLNQPMLLLLFSLLVTIPDPAFDPMAFKRFKKSGVKDYCLVDYGNKVIECNYNDMTSCRENYGKDRRVIVCFPRKSLKLEGEEYEQD